MTNVKMAVLLNDTRAVKRGYDRVYERQKGVLGCMGSAPSANLDDQDGVKAAERICHPA